LKFILICAITLRSDAETFVQEIKQETFFEAPISEKHKYTDAKRELLTYNNRSPLINTDEGQQ
jgi:hypothetical protein